MGEGTTAMSELERDFFSVVGMALLLYALMFLGALL